MSCIIWRLRPSLCTQLPTRALWTLFGMGILTHAFRYSNTIRQHPFHLRFFCSSSRQRLYGDTSTDCRPLFGIGKLRREGHSSTRRHFSSAKLFSTLKSDENKVSKDEGRWPSTDSEGMNPKNSDLTPGTFPDFYVVQTYETTHESFSLEKIKRVLKQSDIDRLGLRSANVTLPAALMVLDAAKYQSMSQARKACRKGNILVHRGPLRHEGNQRGFDREKCFCGRVADRVYPEDVVGYQVRMGSGTFPVLGHKAPPFEVPVLYEDDHFAIVNKPAGVVVNANRNGGHGIMTVRSALTFCLKPASVGCFGVLKRPQPCHRLDKPTSGLLIVAKTKPAMVHLSNQFRDREIKKEYVAIVNGIPPESVDSRISPRQAFEIGVDVDPESKDGYWQLIDRPLDEKSAVTVWRPIKYARSLKARDNYLTMVQLKPKTGRYHQLRRHLAWELGTPIAGDSEYDEGGEAMKLRGRGLFLCSNKVTVQHPFYNSDQGRETFDSIPADQIHDSIYVNDQDTVMVSVSIDPPEKFQSFMSHEDARFENLSDSPGGT